VSDVELRSSVHWNLTHQMPHIPSWFRYGRRTEYKGIFGASLGDILFEKRAAENKIEALNGEVTA
jgi:hypothetical protein